MGFSKQKFAHIPTAAVDNNTGSLYGYELPCNKSSFCEPLIFFATKTAKTDAENFEVNNYVIIITAHVM